MGEEAHYKLSQRKFNLNPKSQKTLKPGGKRKKEGIIAYPLYMEELENPIYIYIQTITKCSLFGLISMNSHVHSINLAFLAGCGCFRAPFNYIMYDIETCYAGRSSKKLFAF